MYAQVIRNSGIRPDTKLDSYDAIRHQANEIAHDRADRHGERYTDEELDRQYLSDEGRKAVPGDEVWHDIYYRGPAGDEYLERLEIDRVYTKQQDGSWDWRRGRNKQWTCIGPAEFVRIFGRNRQAEWPTREENAAVDARAAA